MTSKANESSACVQGIRFSGGSTGLVKKLGGFTKGRHTVPDAVNATTLAFLARLSAEELAEEAEKIFQLARSACAYKRKDIALSLAAPVAQIAAQDFILEIAYSFDGDDPTSYRVTWSLDGLKELDFLQSEACDTLFDGRFSELVFRLTQGAAVETMIDAIEALEECPIQVDYPSDYAHCLLSIPDVEARIRFDGTELAMLFPKPGSPRALLSDFLRLRHLFSLSKSPTLSGILG